MAQEGEYLSAVHLQIDAVDSFESVVVDLREIADLQELVLQLESGNLGGDRLVVFSLQILEFEWVDKCFSSLSFLQGASSLNCFSIESSLFNVVATSTAVLAHAAEEYRQSVSVCLWKDGIEVEAKKQPEPESED
jgi:hypothetical protein